MIFQLQSKLGYSKHWETFNFQIQLSVPARRNLDFSASACPVSGWFEASPWSSMVNCAHNMVETTGIPSTCWNHVLYIGTPPRTGLRLQKQKLWNHITLDEKQQKQPLKLWHSSKNHFINENVVLRYNPIKVMNRDYYTPFYTTIPGLRPGIVVSPKLILCFK